ncbi:MAG: hypothetical protein ACRDZ0_11375, partial [Acidimicrobiales bacterium]
MAPRRSWDDPRPVPQDWSEPVPSRPRQPPEWGDPTVARPSDDWDEGTPVRAPEAFAGDHTAAPPTGPFTWDEPPAGLVEDWAEDDARLKV